MSNLYDEVHCMVYCLFVSAVSKGSNLVYHMFSTNLPSNPQKRPDIYHVASVANDKCSFVTCAVECVNFIGCESHEMTRINSMCLCELYGVDYVNQVSSNASSLVYYQELYTLDKHFSIGGKVI